MTISRKLPPNKSLHWPPGVIVTCFAMRATQAPITGASELRRKASFSMNARQKGLVGLWVGVALLLGLPSFVEPHTVTWIMLPIVGLAILNKDQLTAEKWETPSPVEIFARYPFWKYVAVIYTASIVIAVIYHLFVARLPVFEDPPFFLMFLGLIGPMLGPLVVGQIEAYRNLGADNDA